MAGLTEVQTAEVPISVFNPVGLHERPAAKKLQAELADIAEVLYTQLDEIAALAVTAPSRADFCTTREKLLPAYIKLTIALGNIILAKLDLAELPGIIDASFMELESEFKTAGPSYFGDDAYHEIVFSITTLRNAHRWIPHLLASKLDENKRRDDTELARKFNYAAMWSQFHLDSLMVALRRNQPIIQEVLQELLDGLRSSVMAYAYVRSALDLRGTFDSRYSEALDTHWDAEDEALANAN